jgi:hypothetical protein
MIILAPCNYIAIKASAKTNAIEASFLSFLTTELPLKLLVDDRASPLVVYIISTNEVVSSIGNLVDGLNVDVYPKGANVTSNLGNSRVKDLDF